jgi:hypothetical protein
LPDAALRIIPLTNNNGTLEGTFDIWLDDINAGVKTPYSDKGVLMQNHPNPFSESTNIYFNVFNYSDVRLWITDSQGRTIKELVNQKFVPGRYQSFWDGTTSNGSHVSDGIFFANLVIDGEEMKAVKLLLQK